MSQEETVVIPTRLFDAFVTLGDAALHRHNVHDQSGNCDETCVAARKVTGLLEALAAAAAKDA